MTLVSVQSFGLGDPGGGPRILRALLADAPLPAIAVATRPGPAPPASSGVEQLHLALRPALGRLEGTRLTPLVRAFEPPAAALLSRRLERLLAARDARAVHAVAHELEFWPAYRAARAAALPFFLSVHDDLHYNYRSLGLGRALRLLGRAWRGAEGRFVVSERLGEECCARHGRRPYALVTDGLRAGELAAPQPVTGLRAYFAGLFHRAYAPNLEPFARALELVHERDGRGPAELVLRCGALPLRPAAGVAPAVLPFGSEQDVRDDLARADLLYMPLPFASQAAPLVAFSLSTKLITYLGSGRPIVYHGPAAGAAHELLAGRDAAILATSLRPEAIAAALEEGLGRADEIVANALALAAERFMLADQRERFWTPILAAAR